MPVKKRSLKKEVLPDPNTISNGQLDYFIGGWSAYRTIESLTEISHSVVEACTAADRTVKPLPRTNVLLLPSEAVRAGGSTGNEGIFDSQPMMEVEVADGLYVEGVSIQMLREKAHLMKNWKPAQTNPETQELAPHESAAATSGTQEGSNGHDTSEQLDNPVQGTLATHFSHEDDEVKAEESNSAEKNERLLTDLRSAAPRFGADFGAMDSCVTGDVHIIGVEPNLVVHPNLPVRPVEESTKATPRQRRGSSKSKKRLKLTPEQLAEIDQKRAEAEAEYERQVQEAIDYAKKQEDHLKTFAHPDRWAKVVFSNMTFSGAVRVSRAHVTFQNCRFTHRRSDGLDDQSQLSVSPYCVVQCIKCTFETSLYCGLYAFSSSHVSVKRCLFTGLSQWELAVIEDSAKISTRPKPDKLRDSAADLPDECMKNFATSTPAAEDVHATSGGVTEMDPPDVLLEHYETSRGICQNSVGIYIDGAQGSIEDCRFIFLGTAVLFRGRYSATALSNASNNGVVKAEAPMALVRSFLHHIYVTAVLVEAIGVLLKMNRIQDCGYYGLDCRVPSSRLSVTGNYFGMQSTIRIREGVKAKMMHNELQGIPLDDNKYENPCLEPIY